MKKNVILFLIVPIMSALAEMGLKANATLLITNSLPILPNGYCSGIFTITNTGTIPFTIVTNLTRADMPIYFRREYKKEQEDAEDRFRGGDQRKTQQKLQLVEYYNVITNNSGATVVLLPTECVVIPIPYFTFEGDGELYKSEFYIGSNTWIPVSITPPIGHAKRIGIKNDNFYYATEGTNQYLYFKEDKKFTRIGGMKMGTKPKLTGDSVVFNSADNATQKITRSTALQIIQEHEKAQKQKE